MESVITEFYCFFIVCLSCENKRAERLQENKSSSKTRMNDVIKKINTGNTVLSIKTRKSLLKRILVLAITCSVVSSFAVTSRFGLVKVEQKNDDRVTEMCVRIRIYNQHCVAFYEFAFNFFYQNCN